MTVTLCELMARRSAVEELGGRKVVISMMRKIRKSTLPPVVFVNVRRKLIVPNAPFGSARSRERLGGADWETVESKSEEGNCEFFWIGLKRFCGPGAPSLCPMLVNSPSVETGMKSERLSSVSFGRPP